jgi:hypothetical protein
MDYFKLENSIILERNGTKATVFVNDELNKRRYSNTIVRSYLLANFYS